MGEQPATMEGADFDSALIGAAFSIAAAEGWRRVSVAKAARAAGLDLARARLRFPNRISLLLRFGALADQAALTGVDQEGPVRDRLFDMLMRRIDTFQSHRPGVLALFRELPLHPETSLLLIYETQRSMRWMLEGAGVSTTGLQGALFEHGLVGVWLWTLRAWQGDHTEDLTATMAALDDALRRAESAARWLGAEETIGVAEDRAEREPGPDTTLVQAPPPPAPPEPPASPPPV
ncbi:MAG: TetR family transcriptional regulator [Acetobacteraceae bacterium]|nr:TetR family transcriptional regulator [Acetobacteraceae bacterium]